MINGIIEEKINLYDRKIKRNFVNAYWIHQSLYFVELHKDKYKDQKVLNRIYKQKHKCIKAMIDSGKNTLKIYRPSEYRHKWLIVIENELEGLKYNLVIPYQLLDIDISELEETNLNRDCIFYNRDEISPIATNANRRRKLDFCLENMEKSRLKLLETI